MTACVTVCVTARLEEEYDVPEGGELGEEVDKGFVLSGEVGAQRGLVPREAELPY